MKVLCVVAEKSWERISGHAVQLSSTVHSLDRPKGGGPTQADLLVFSAAEPAEDALPPRDTQNAFTKRLFCRIEGSVTQAQLHILDVVAHVVRQTTYDLILFAGSTDADLLAVRTAVRLSGSALTAAERLQLDGDHLTATRSAFSYNMHAVCRLTSKPWCVSIRPDAAETVPPTPVNDDTGKAEHPGTTSTGTEHPGIITTDTAQPVTEIPQASTLFQNAELPENTADGKGSAPADHSFCTCTRSDSRTGKSALEEAELVLIGGRGIGGREALGRIRAAAARLHGAVGVSRPCAADGWTGFEDVVGISGKTIRPKVCIVLAASGSMPFLMGIRNSSLVIAVNRDPGAPIFRASDYGIASDWKDLVEILERDL